jgi:CBS domain-containing protein
MTLWEIVFLSACVHVLASLYHLIAVIFCQCAAHSYLCVCLRRVHVACAAAGVVTNVITQSGLLAEIGRLLFDPVVKTVTTRTLTSLGLDHHPVISVSIDDTVWAALKLMSDHTISAVPIIGMDGACAHVSVRVFVCLIGCLFVCLFVRSFARLHFLPCMASPSCLDPHLGPVSVSAFDRQIFQLSLPYRRCLLLCHTDGRCRCVCVCVAGMVVGIFSSTDVRTITRHIDVYPSLFRTLREFLMAKVSCRHCVPHPSCTHPVISSHWHPLTLSCTSCH